MSKYFFLTFDGQRVFLTDNVAFSKYPQTTLKDVCDSIAATLLNQRFSWQISTPIALSDAAMKPTSGLTSCFTHHAWGRYFSSGPVQACKDLSQMIEYYYRAFRDDGHKDLGQNDALFLYDPLSIPE